jgi:hypothetical protein
MHGCDSAGVTAALMQATVVVIGDTKVDRTTRNFGLRVITISCVLEGAQALPHPRRDESPRDAP